MSAFDPGKAGIPVKRLRRPSLEEFQAYRRKGPVILTHCMDDWKFFKELTRLGTDEKKLAYLGSLSGRQNCRFSVIPAAQKGELGFTDDIRSRNFKFQEKPFSRIAELILRSSTGKSTDTVYMKRQWIPDLPLLEQALTPMPIFPKKITPAFCYLWAGSGNHIINLHYDTYMNFIMMLAGRKRVRLLPFHVLRDIYPAPLDKGFIGAPSSCVRLLSPDPEKYPRFKEALKEMRVADLEAGEILSFPPYWWHHAESFGVNFMINTWIHDIPAAIRGKLNRNRLQGMSLFHDLSEKDRRGFRRIYEAAFKGRADSRRPKSPAWSRELERHLRQTAALHGRLPEYHQKVNKTFYDHYVFQRDGDPFPNLPGEFSRMVERMSPEAFAPAERGPKHAQTWYKDA